MSAVLGLLQRCHRHPPHLLRIASPARPTPSLPAPPPPRPPRHAPTPFCCRRRRCCGLVHKLYEIDSECKVRLAK